MPLDVVRLRDSDLAALETPDACWAAVLLWCASWHQQPAASLPNDDRVLANLAGFGRVVKEWMKVRDGALRGWELCEDGRLYHPVIAEKAIDAYRGKLQQAWKTECGRIKKHNQRHPDNQLEFPTFDQWLSQNSSLDCPGDNLDMSQGQGEGVPDLSPGKPTPREKDRERDRDINDLSNTEENSNTDDPTLPGLVCLELKKLKIQGINPAHPMLLALLEAGATVEQFTFAAQAASVKTMAYVVGVVKGQREQAAAAAPGLAKGKLKVVDTAWRKDDNAIVRKAQELKIGTQGKTRDQLLSAIDAKQEQIDREAARGEKAA